MAIQENTPERKLHVPGTNLGKIPPPKISEMMQEMGDAFYKSHLTGEGDLSMESFEIARKLAADPNTKVSDVHVRQAKRIAENAGIDPLPEETIKIFAVLRSPEQERIQGNRHMKMSDRPLFAEILYRQGKHEALEKFVKLYPVIFTGPIKKE